MIFLTVTCNKTKHILPAFDYQYEKYVRNADFQRHVIDLGDEPVSEWTTNVYKRIKGITDEFVILSLDDYLMIDAFDSLLFEIVMDKMRSTAEIVRYELGFGAWKKGCTMLNADYDANFGVFKYGRETPYKSSCQISVWRTEYLLKLLSNKWSIWDFEIKGSEMATKDGVGVIGTRGQHALRWIEESALSARHPGRVNLLGMRLGDIHELIDKGKVDKNKIQFGMAKNAKYEVGMLDVLNIGNRYKKYYY